MGFGVCPKAGFVLCACPMLATAEAMTTTLQYNAKQIGMQSNPRHFRCSPCRSRCRTMKLVVQSENTTTAWGSGGKKCRESGPGSPSPLRFPAVGFRLTRMGAERRRVPRYSAHVNATIKLPAESTALAVLVEDLCILGCLLERGPMLEPHQDC